MARPINFPNVKPTGRQYNPGEYPQSEFKALNGATTITRFGSRRTDSELELSFKNISDEDAAAIVANYEAVNREWNYVRFTKSNGGVGAGAALQPYLQESKSGLRWRYAGAPSVTSVVPGISSVECRFRGTLDGV
jgi:hypothetical protein